MGCNDRCNCSGEPIFEDMTKSFEDRAADLVSRMTLDEKVSQMVNLCPAIERLGVPEYEWWNECLHGVARGGTATVFPQAIGMAASWNSDLLHRVGQAVSDEARARHHEAVRQGVRSRYNGLTFWTPNINIFRDPRWGRGQETYGEDPYLTGRMGVAYIRGLQGDDPRYLKVSACAKHYAVHSGPENDRHCFDARASRKDMFETYLPAFEDCVVEAKVESIMGAYNRTNGEPCCASKTLLTDILRDKWGFAGHVVSDCGAIEDIHLHHKLVETAEESAAMGVRNGCDLCCGEAYSSLGNAVRAGLITESEIDTALRRIFLTRFKLGVFDEPDAVPFTSIPYEVADCDQHRELAADMARQSIVLLKNSDSLLPLPKDLGTIAVIGPNADTWDSMVGNYAGTPSKYVAPLQGIQESVLETTRVVYARGCDIVGDATDGIWESVAAAERADAVVMCLGLSCRVEGEEGDADLSEAAGDRIDIGLSAAQKTLFDAVVAVGKPVVVVLMTGSAIAVPDVHEKAGAIIEAWYPGEEGGSAIADVLFGDYNPAGRLPVTFVKSVDDLPPFDEYAMAGRTYRYMTAEPLYPFGFGLSYSSFAYSGASVEPASCAAGESVRVSVTVTNKGKRAGDEVVQVYISMLDKPEHWPVRKLAGFKRVSLRSGESKRVEFELAPKDIATVNENGERLVEAGTYRVTVGGSQGDARSLELGAAPALTVDFAVE